MSQTIRTIEPPETCWTTKTPFQVGCLLTLCVTVPFFIGMVIVYSLSITVGKSTDRCYRMCALLWDWEMTRTRDNPTDYGDVIDFATTPEGTIIITNATTALVNVSSSAATPNKPKANSTSARNAFNALPNPILEDVIPQVRYPRDSGFCLSHFARSPAVAALLESLFVDDHQELILRCPVPVIAPGWVLTTDDCLGDHQDSLYVRVNSDFWSTGGILRKVNKLVKLDGFVALQLPLIELDDELCYFPVDASCSVSSKGKIWFWNSNLQQPLENKTKYEPIEDVDIVLEEIGNRFGFSDATTDFVGQKGAPVLDQNSGLIGFQESACKRDVKEELEYKSLKKFCDWQRLMKFIS